MERSKRMQTNWEGQYLDGQTAAHQRAAIQLMRSGLQLTTEGGLSCRWPYAEIRQTQGFYAGETVRLERGGEIPEVLLLEDPAFLTALHQVAPEHTAHLHHPARRRRRATLTLLAALAVVGISVALYLQGIPALAVFVASRVPISWEEKLGQAVVRHLAPSEKRCLDPTRARMLDDIITTLTAPLPNSPYTIRVIVVNEPILNAFAAPGGYIVLFRGLLEHTRTAEELAGILAHELQHILQRHATRALFQHASAGLLLAALTGDTGRAGTFGLEGAALLGLLRYSRHQEEEADTEGMGMLLAAGIDTVGMIDFFKSLSEEGKNERAFLQYLSTHPSTADRIERLQSRLGQSPPTPVKLLPGYDWPDIRKMCRRESEG